MQGKLSPVVVNSYQPLREIVCEVLRDAIRGGVLKPGEWLKENDLADELLVSRTPVREAIRKLEQEGYVVTVPRRGAYVASVSIRDINEIFEIRAALEALACELAAERITEEEQERLERLLVAIGRAIEEHDMERIVQTDIEFHELLYQAARNERLLAIIGNLREQLTRFRTIPCRIPGVSRRHWRSTALLSMPSVRAMPAVRAKWRQSTWRTRSRRCSVRLRNRKRRRGRPCSSGAPNEMAAMPNRQ